MKRRVFLGNVNRRACPAGAGRVVMTVFFIFTLFLLTGCSWRDLFINDTEVHNGLVERMDAVLEAEKEFYDEYWVLTDGADTGLFAEAYGVFAVAVDELDTYFSETEFASSQQVFAEAYEDYYDTAVSEYIEYAGGFVEEVTENGYSFEELSDYFADMDGYTVGFVEVHNQLINTINSQSDRFLQGQTY